MYLAPSLSARVMIALEDVDLAARCMAAAIFFGFFNVIAAIVEPLPLKNAPSAPAFSAAAMTRGRNGISFCLNGS
jgi:hypothetical protein